MNTLKKCFRSVINTNQRGCFTLWKRTLIFTYKCRLFLFDFNQICSFSTDFRKGFLIWCVTEIRRVGAALMHADRQTLICAFRDTTNPPKKTPYPSAMTGTLKLSCSSHYCNSWINTCSVRTSQLLYNPGNSTGHWCAHILIPVLIFMTDWIHIISLQIVSRTNHQISPSKYKHFRLSQLIPTPTCSHRRLNITRDFNGNCMTFYIVPYPWFTPCRLTSS